MRILRHTESIHTEIKENTDQDISNLLTRHVDFAAEYHDPDVGDLLIVFIVEPGDTLATIDRANECSRRQVGDPDFVPCFESLEEQSTVYEVLFIQSDEGHALVLLVSKAPNRH